MPTFEYKARDPKGEQIRGTLVAESYAAAARMLDERTLLPVEVNEQKAAGQALFSGGSRKVSASKVGMFYEQLADLLKAGVPALRALNVLSKQSSNAALSRVVREVHEDVSGGETLSGAMDKHPTVFRQLHVSMIRAGEKGGFLEDVLHRLSDFVSRQDELRNKFIGSMIYPCVLLGGALSAVTLLMVLVVPRIRQLLEGQDLPIPSLIVFAISDAISRHYPTIGGVALVLFLGIYGFMRSKPGRELWAFLQLRAWGVGKIYTMVALCRFCRIFGTMLRNGIPILHALRISKDSAGNKILADAIDKAAESVGAGEPLTTPLLKSKVFPPAMLDMIAVAEESNTLEKVLIDIADTQEARTGRQLDLFVRMLEPMLLMLMGMMVLFIAVALLLPILNMATSGLK